MTLIDFNNKAVGQLSKKELAEVAKKDAAQKMAEGYSSALDLTVMLRKAAEYISAYVKALDSPAREELYQEDNKEADRIGAKLSLSSTGQRLDYSADPIYSDLQNRLKEREELLKLAHKSKDAIFDQYAAEVPRVPVKYASREVLKIRL